MNAMADESHLAGKAATWLFRLFGTLNRRGPEAQLPARRIRRLLGQKKAVNHALNLT